jgi:formylmethanofuran dehydrogenase subunit B
MPASASTSLRTTAPWTCTFCPLLCDSFGVNIRGGSPVLSGSECRRAIQGLAYFGAATPTARPQLNGRAVDLDTAIGAAARLLAASSQPLFGGLGTDVAGARALYRLACATGAISDAANGTTLMQGLRALQDRGAFTTTLAEVRERADLIVCVGGSPAQDQPEFFRRCGIGEAVDTGAPMVRHIVVLGGGTEAAWLQSLNALAGVSTEDLPVQGDLFDALGVLAALVAGHSIESAPPALNALAARLLAARYAVLVWEGARLLSHGALLVERINTIVGTLNQTTRAAALPLGGGNGADTVNQVFAWLSGLPLRSRATPMGLEHEPLRFDVARLLADNAVDSLLWVQAFGPEPTLPAAEVPRIVLAHPGVVLPPSTRESVFIPVSTPGIGSSGHLFRTDGVVLLPLHALYDDGLPSVADVVQQLTVRVSALRTERSA